MPHLPMATVTPRVKVRRNDKKNTHSSSVSPWIYMWMDIQSHSNTVSYPKVPCLMLFNPWRAHYSCAQAILLSFNVPSSSKRMGMVHFISAR